MDVDIEAKVLSSDGRVVGKVKWIVIDPQKNEIVDLVVHHSKSLLEVRDVVVPISTVSRALKGEIDLTLPASQVENLPDFVENEYIPPPPDWFAPAPFPPGGILWPAGFAATALTREERRNVPEGSVALSEGTEVVCPDGRIGVIDWVVSAPDQRVQGFVVRKGGIFTRDVFIPMDWIAEVHDERVVLNRTKAEVQHLKEREKH